MYTIQNKCALCEEATADDYFPDDYFPDDIAPKTDSIISGPYASDDCGSALTPSVISLPTTHAKVNDAAPGDAVGNMETDKCSFVKGRTLMLPTRDEADDLMSFLKAQMVQDGTR